MQLLTMNELQQKMLRFVVLRDILQKIQLLIIRATVDHK